MGEEDTVGGGVSLCMGEEDTVGGGVSLCMGEEDTVGVGGGGGKVGHWWGLSLQGV